MNEKLKQCVMELLRMGVSPDDVTSSLREATGYMSMIKDYKPNHDLADFYRAFKDADHRP